MCPNMDRRRDWIITVRLGCLVILLTSSSLRTNWCHLIPSSVLKHHWSRASIMRASITLYRINWRQRVPKMSSNCLLVSTNTGLWLGLLNSIYHNIRWSNRENWLIIDDQHNTASLCSTDSLAKYDSANWTLNSWQSSGSAVSGEKTTRLWCGPARSRQGRRVAEPGGHRRVQGQLSLLPSGRWGNAHRPKCGDALWLGSKGKYGSVRLWLNCWGWQVKLRDTFVGTWHTWAITAEYHMKNNIQICRFYCFYFILALHRGFMYNAIYLLLRHKTLTVRSQNSLAHPHSLLCD